MDFLASKTDSKSRRKLMCDLIENSRLEKQAKKQHYLNPYENLSAPGGNLDPKKSFDNH